MILLIGMTMIPIFWYHQARSSTFSYPCSSDTIRIASSTPVGMHAYYRFKRCFGLWMVVQQPQSLCLGGVVWWLSRPFSSGNKNNNVKIYEIQDIFFKQEKKNRKKRYLAWPRYSCCHCRYNLPTTFSNTFFCLHPFPVFHLQYLNSCVWNCPLNLYIVILWMSQLKSVVFTIYLWNRWK